MRQNKRNKNNIRKSPAKAKTFLSKEYFIQPKKSKWEYEEFGPGKIDIVFCPECGIVYYDKSWHHNLRHKKNVEHAKRVSFELCPACQMAKHNQYEGEIRISGLPATQKKEIIRLIEAFGKKARERDPLDRILKIKSFDSGVSVHVSENQMTQRLAKKLNETYKKNFSKPVIHKGKGGDVFIITMSFQK
ncbi:MAG: hypothetical protein HYW71_01555 [Candidatus Niyogibacteria bacterium]|nr:hypothetical protein [Candidatus Niyogibacteria bacterium]